MKKLLVLFFNLLLIISVSISQKTLENVDYKFGETHKDKASDYFYNFKPLGYNEIGPLGYLVPTKAELPSTIIIGGIKDYGIMQLSHDSEPVKRNYIDLSVGDHKKTFEHLFKLGEKIILITSFQNQSDKKFYYFIETIDENTLEQNNDAKKIAELSYSEANKFHNSYSGITMSPDSSKFLFEYTLIDKKGFIQNQGFYVLNSDLTENWNLDSKFGVSKDSIAAKQSSSVSNNGDVSFFYTLFKDNNDRRNYNNSRYKEKVSIDNNYSYRAITFFKSGGGNIYDLKLDNHFAKVAEFTTTDEEIIFGGLYSKNNSSKAIGSFLQRINKSSKELISSDQTLFKSDFVETENLNKKGKKRVKYFFYLTTPIIHKPDGGFVVSFEQAWRKKSGELTFSSRSNIITSNYNSSGGLIRSNVILKEQYEHHTHVYSFSQFYLKNKLYFFYANYKKSNFLGFLSDFELFATSIDEVGEKKTERIFNKNTKKIIYSPKDARLSSENSIVIYGDKKMGREYSFLNIKF